MTEVLVRTVQGGEAEAGASLPTEAGRLLFSDSYLEVWVAGDLKDREFRAKDGNLCLLLGHVAGKRSAESIHEEYRDHGAAGVAALDGHFVMVLYDRAKSEVSIIHDKAGLRHAYYWSCGEKFALSTKLSWLMDSSVDERALRPRLSRQGLALYLAFQYLPTPYTMFEGVFQLPPGAELVNSRGRQAGIHRHVEFPEPGSGELDGGPEEHGRRIAGFLGESMAEQLDGELRIGAMLSGGYDTTANVALMVEQLGVRPVTFTAAFREPSYDEASFAKLVADHYGLEHVEVEIEPRLHEMLPDAVTSFDNPNADQAVFAEYFLCRAARERNCGPMVTGEGGDEILGYPRADGDGLDFRDLPDDQGKLARLYFEQTFLAPRELRTEMLGHLGVDPDIPYEYLESVYRKFPARSPFERIYFGQWRTWLLDGVYMKDSRVSERFGLTPVFPFMDTRLMRYVADLPLSRKLAGLDDKRYLRTVLDGRVPRQILEREKHKFWLPFAGWFRAEARDYLRDNLLASDGFVVEHLGGETVRRLVDEHEAGTADHSRLLWAFLFLEIWFQDRARRWVSRSASYVG